MNDQDHMGMKDLELDDQDNNDDEQTDSDNDGDDFVHPKFSTHDEESKDEESFDPIVRTPSHDDNTDDEDNDEDSDWMNVEGEEGANKEDDADESYRDVNINLESRDIQMADVQTTQVIEDTHVTLTPVNPEGQQQSSFMSSRFVSNMLNPSPDTAPSQANVLSSSLQDLPNFGSLFGFDNGLKTLETNFSEFMQTNQFSKAVYLIIIIVDKYIDHQMNEAVKVAVRLQLDMLRDEAQAENEDFLNKLDENIQKIIKEKVKVQVSKILPKIERTINEQLKAEVLSRSSNSSKTSYVVAADLSELELKKNLIEKMESNKSIHRSDEQKNLYKALFDAYECNKLILDTYGDTVTLKRCRDDEDKDEEPSAGSNRGSKRRQEGKEPELTSAPKEKTSKTSGKPTEGSKSQHKIASESAPVEEPIHSTQDLEEPTHQEFETGATDDQPVEEASQHSHCNLAKKVDSRTSFNELMDTPVNFSSFVMNHLNVDVLTLELLAGLTYELMKGSCKSLVELEFFLEEVYNAKTDQLDWNNPKGKQYLHDLLKPLPLIPNSRGRRVIPFDHFINNDLEYLCGGASSRKYTTSVTKTKAANYGHIKWIEDLGRKRQQFYGFTVNREYARDVYSKRRIIAITELQIFEWHNYKHLDWITICRDDDKLYKFKEGVKSYQKKLNLTKPDTYRSDLKRKEAYTAYSNPRGFFYQNKDKQKRLMHIDELHKFSNDTLNDVQTALDDPTKDKKDYAEFGEVCWWEIVRGRLSAASKDHMIYHMMSSSNKDYDGIPKRPTMYLNLWSNKAVRRRYSNPMIQPESEGSTHGYPLVIVEVLRILKDRCEDYDHGSFGVFPSYEAKHQSRIHFHVERKLRFLQGVGRKSWGKNQLMKANQESERQHGQQPTWVHHPLDKDFQEQIESDESGLCRELADRQFSGVVVDYFFDRKGLFYFVDDVFDLHDVPMILERSFTSASTFESGGLD
uniref:Uncharacterized protein n=1 Tax=Tanacetum cinerariifolium TaxID=118510 RepID=A0A6L2P226_TANCI|nr:hypothetical protein [Tanacetum cinerariifolium]